MEVIGYFDRLDKEARAFLSHVYVDTLRDLSIAGHPALWPPNRRETSILLCWRIVTLSIRGVWDPAVLKAFAIAGIDPEILRRKLFISRAAFEIEDLRHELLIEKIACGKLAMPDELEASSKGLSIARTLYVRLLALSASERL